MVEIELKLFVTLARYLPENPDRYPVPRGTTLEGLMDALSIPQDSVKLIFVNGRKQERAYVLSTGDRVGLFPPVGGG